MAAFRGARLVRTGAATLAIATVVAILHAITPTTAAAASAAPVVLVSSDGVNFSETLPRGLFDGAGALVPGGRVSATLWVRNPESTFASLRISARDATSTSTAFADGVDLSAKDSLSGMTTTRPFSGLGTCSVLTTVQDVAPGGVVSVDLALAMDDVDGSTAQGESARFDLMVAMRDSTGGPLAASACEDDGVIVSSTGSTPRSTIAFTGGGLPIGGLIAGSLIFGSGVALIAARRRRSADERP